jgi:hypothetical protein
VKTKVKVDLVARQTVLIEVEHEEDEDPFDLTPEDEKAAKAVAKNNGWPYVEVEEVYEG